MLAHPSIRAIASSSIEPSPICSIPAKWHRPVSDSSVSASTKQLQPAGHSRTDAMLAGGNLKNEVEATTQVLNLPPGSEIGTIGCNRPAHGDGQARWNLAPLIPSLSALAASTAADPS
jgi:hypothetical protein